MSLQTTNAPVDGGGVHHQQDAQSPEATVSHDGIESHVVDYATPYPYRDRHHRRHVKALDHHVGRWS